MQNLMMLLFLSCFVIISELGSSLLLVRESAYISLISGVLEFLLLWSNCMTISNLQRQIFIPIKFLYHSPWSIEVKKETQNRNWHRGHGGGMYLIGLFLVACSLWLSVVSNTTNQEVAPLATSRAFPSQSAVKTMNNELADGAIFSIKILSSQICA